MIKKFDISKFEICHFWTMNWMVFLIFLCSTILDSTIFTIFYMLNWLENDTIYRILRAGVQESVCLWFFVGFRSERVGVGFHSVHLMIRRCIQKKVWIFIQNSSNQNKKTDFLQHKSIKAWSNLFSSSLKMLQKSSPYRLLYLVFHK